MSIAFVAWFASCSALALPQVQDPPGGLTLGVPVAGTITSQSPALAAPALERVCPSKSERPCRANAHELQVASAGVYRIELTADLFDAYLVLRGKDGTVLAENDNGGLVTHALIEAKLEGGRPYVVEAGSLFGRPGGYRLVVEAGAARRLSPVARGDAQMREAERILAERDRQLEPNHHLIATACDTLGTYHWQRRQFAAALPLMERALRIWQTTGSEFVGYGHIEVGAQLQGLNRLDEARQHLERAVELLSQSERGKHTYLSLALNNLATLEQQVGNNDAAERHLRRSVEVAEVVHGAGHDKVATALTSLGHLLITTGRLDEPEEILQRALSIRRATLAPDDPIIAYTLTNLGYCRMKRGRYEEALGLFEEALRLRRAATRGLDPGVMESQANVAQAMMILGRFAEAEPLLRSAVRAASLLLPPGSPQLCELQTIFASVLADLGRFDEAVAASRQAVRMLELAEHPENRLFASAVMSLAFALSRQQEAQGMPPDDECIALFERAKEIYERIDPDSQDYMHLLNRYADALSRRKQIAAAEVMLRRGITVGTKVLGERNPATSGTRNNLALLLRVQGKHQEAEQHLRVAYDLAQEAYGGRHPATISPRGNLAGLLQETGRLHEAVELARSMALDYAAWQAQLVASGDESGAMLQADASREGIDLFLGLASLDGRAEVVAEAFQLLMEWQGLAFRGGRVMRERLVAAAGQTRAEWDRLRALQARIGEMVVRPGAATAELQDLVEQRRGLEAQLVRQMRLSLPPLVTVREVAAALPEGSALVDLHVHADHVVGRFVDGKYELLAEAREPLLSAWVVRAGEPRVHHVALGRATHVERALGAHLAALRGGGDRGSVLVPSPGRDPDVQTDFAAAVELHRILWQPVAAALGDSRRVFVFASGALATLPFETMRTADGKFLLEMIAFSYLDDPVGVVPRASEAGGSGSSLLVVSGVDYGSRGAGGAPIVQWAALPASVDEGAAVAAMWREAFADRPVKTATKGEPTAAWLAAELGRHAVVHLATHARFDTTASGSPDLAAHRASLVGAGANSGQADSALLSAEQVAWLDLTGTRLVVLSACETALGVARAANTMSLRRAFHVAGAKDVISSMWRVEDRATAELMRDFYEGVWRRGLEPVRALREAQLAMLTRYRAQPGAAPRPATWGAFVHSVQR